VIASALSSTQNQVQHRRPNLSRLLLDYHHFFKEQAVAYVQQLIGDDNARKNQYRTYEGLDCFKGMTDQMFSYLLQMDDETKGSTGGKAMIQNPLESLLWII
jgi:hypothetical protein